MSRDEIGVQVSLDNMFELPAIAGCRLQVDIHIPLRIDDGCHALRAHRVGCVGQTAQVESLDPHRFHAGSFDAIIQHSRLPRADSVWSGTGRCTTI